DPHNLEIRTIVSGEVLQDSNTSLMIFKIPYLIAYLSEVFALEPGDIISTGTPDGVGFVRKPPRFLKPGDRVRVEVSGLGFIENPVIAESR
ncbi:MAG TPA: fumarylacetoacetate hydrolase family protein, partial [bacterium]|nr:fumarylacetoacetate hydrolase family protein [bacterium]